MINDEFTHSKFNNSKFYMYNAAGQKPRTMEYARTATPRRGSFGEYAAYSPDAERSRSMAINSLSWQLNKNPYLYNGKELHTELNLNLHDYGARYYDAAVGRWWSIDPLIEKHFDYTPYAYVYNNPLLFIDPFGMDTVSSYANHTVNEHNVDRITETTTVRNNTDKSVTTTIFKKTYKLTADDGVEISGTMDISQTMINTETGENTLVTSSGNLDINSENSTDLKSAVLKIKEQKEANGGVSPILKERNESSKKYDNPYGAEFGIISGVVMAPFTPNILTGIKAATIAGKFVNAIPGAVAGYCLSKGIDYVNSSAKNSHITRYSLNKQLYAKFK